MKCGTLEPLRAAMQQVYEGFQTTPRPSFQTSSPDFEKVPTWRWVTHLVQQQQQFALIQH